MFVMLSLSVCTPGKLKRFDHTGQALANQRWRVRVPPRSSKLFQPARCEHTQRQHHKHMNSFLGKAVLFPVGTFHTISYVDFRHSEIRA